MKKRNYKIVHSCYGRCFLTGLLILTLLPVPAAAKSYSDPPLSAEAVYDWAAWMYDPATKTMTYSAPGTKACRALNPSIYGDKGWYMEAQRVVIGEGITEIGEEAFGFDSRVDLGEYAKLTEVTLPSTLKVIEDRAFYRCSSLKQVTLNEGLERIGWSAFESVPLESVEIPGSVKEIEPFAFSIDEPYHTEYNALKSVTFHDGLLKLEDFALKEQFQLEEVALPDTVEELGGYVFSECYSLRKVKLPANLKTLRESLFDNCKSLKTIALPESLVQIEADVFSRSGVCNITIPSNVEKLGTKYKNKKYYESVKGIFNGCKHLKKVKIKSRKLKKVYPRTFVNTPKNVVFVVPNGLKKKYTKLLRKGGLPKKVKIKEAKRI